MNTQLATQRPAQESAVGKKQILFIHGYILKNGKWQKISNKPLVCSEGDQWDLQDKILQKWGGTRLSDRTEWGVNKIYY